MSWLQKWRDELRLVRRLARSGLDRAGPSRTSRGRTISVFHWFFLIALVPHLSAQDVIVRTQLTPEEVWVGQRMQLQIDVLGKDGWAQIADLSELEVPGSYVRPAGNSRVRLNETIGGESYSGQRYELSIYPQRSGEQELPSIELLVKVQTWGAKGGTQEIAAHTDAVAFTTLLPEGADPNLPLIVSTDFQATQSWEPDQSAFKVGEALKRHITLKSSDLPAMVLPPLLQGKVEGISAYPQSPQLEDNDAGATRKESATYVFEQNDKAALSAYSVQWWNPKQKRLERITLEGRELVITSGVALPSTGEEQTASSRKIPLGLLTVISISLALFTWHQLNQRQKPRKTHEPTVFKQVTQSAQSGNATATLNGLLAWLDLIDLPPSQFFASYADEPTRKLGTRLVCDPQNTPNISSFASGLQAARKRYLKQQGQLSKADTVLPPLNL